MGKMWLWVLLGGGATAGAIYYLKKNAAKVSQPLIPLAYAGGGAPVPSTKSAFTPPQSTVTNPVASYADPSAAQEGYSNAQASEGYSNDAGAQQQQAQVQQAADSSGGGGGGGSSSPSGVNPQAVAAAQAAQANAASVAQNQAATAAATTGATAPLSGPTAADMAKARMLLQRTGHVVPGQPSAADTYAATQAANGNSPYGTPGAPPVPQAPPPPIGPDPTPAAAAHAAIAHAASMFNAPVAPVTQQKPVAQVAHVVSMPKAAPVPMKISAGVVGRGPLVRH